MILKRKRTEGGGGRRRALFRSMSGIDKLNKRTNALTPDKFPPGFPYGRCTYDGPRVIREKLCDSDSGALRMIRYTDGCYFQMQGPKGQEWYVTLENPEKAYTGYFRKIFGVVREVRREYHRDGWSVQFTDQQHDMYERVRAVHHASKREVHYEGKVGAFRLVAILNYSSEFATAMYFEGGPGFECKVRTVHPKCDKIKVGYVAHFDGPRRFCATSRIVYDDGRISFFEGGFGNECLVKRKTAKGAIQIFEGERSKERKVEERAPSGNVFFFKGEKNAEHCVRVISENGRKISLFHGEKGKEILSQCIEFKDDDTANVTHFTGPRGSECRKRTLHGDGTLDLFAGGSLWNEHAWRTVDADGHVLTNEAPPHAPQEWQFDDAAVPEHKKRRIQNTTMELWNKMEALAENGDMNEQALLVLGGTFQSLRSEVAD